jgi:hypothetical protein
MFGCQPRDIVRDLSLQKAHGVRASDAHSSKIIKGD